MSYRDEVIAELLPCLNLTRTRTAPEILDSRSAAFYKTDDKEIWDVAVVDGCRSVWIRKRGTHFWFHVKVEDIVKSMCKTADQFLKDWMKVA